jgi:Skp family chaperone for outer membrane proteins
MRQIKIRLRYLPLVLALNYFKILEDYFMKSKIISTALLLIGITTGGCAVAKEQTIGFVDREQIITKTLYFKDMQEAMKKQFKSRADNAEAKRKQFLAEQEALDRDRDILSEADLRKRTELSGEEEELSQEVEAFQGKYNKKIYTIFLDVVAQLAKENNLDIVLPGEISLYGGKKYDYTFRAVELMDKSFKESKKS